MSEIRVVAPINMGKGLVFDGDKYNVDLSEVNTITVEAVDNGTADVKHEFYKIDYGNGLVEYGGRYMLALPPVFETTAEHSEWVAKQQKPNKHFAEPVPVKYFSPSRFENESNTQFYHKESAIVFTLEELGLRSILSVSCTAGDILGVRTETSWVVNDRFDAPNIVLGIHTIATAEELAVPLFYSFKGIKA